MIFKRLKHFEYSLVSSIVPLQLPIQSSMGSRDFAIHSFRTMVDFLLQFLSSDGSKIYYPSSILQVNLAWT